MHLLLITSFRCRYVHGLSKTICWAEEECCVLLHLHMPLQRQAQGWGTLLSESWPPAVGASHTLPIRGDREGSHPAFRCQGMGGGRLVESRTSDLAEDVVEQGVGSRGCRSRALPRPSDLHLGAPAGPRSRGLVRVSWDPQVSCHAGSVAKSYKHCGSTGCKELFSVDVIDPKARCVWFCQQHPSYSTFQYPE